MRNKVISLLLGGVMILSMLTGCGDSKNPEQATDNKQQESADKSTEKQESESASSEEENPYEERITVTWKGIGTVEGFDYLDCPTYDVIDEKFNVDINMEKIIYDLVRFGSRTPCILGFNKCFEI